MNYHRLAMMLVFASALLAAAQTNAVSNTTQQLQGHLSVVWGDYQDGRHTPLQIALRPLDSDQIYSLDIPEYSSLRKQLFRLNGKLVRVQGKQSAFKRGGDNRFQVTHIEGPKQKREGVGGSLKYLSILVKYAGDDREPNDLDYFKRMYGSEPGQINHYWAENSYGKVDVTGDAVGWLTLPQPRSYYVGNGIDLNSIAEHAVAALPGSVDLNAYDGMNIMVNDTLNGAAYGGSSTVNWNGSAKSLPTTWNPPWAYQSVGVIFHEMGHSFGLPHSNNSNRDSNTYDSRYDVMSMPFHSSLSSEYGTWGQHTITYHKDMLGWIDEESKVIIDSTGVYTVLLDDQSLPNAQNPKMIILETCSQDERVATTLEARGLFGYDKGLGGQAVVVHNIYEGRGQPAWMLQPGDDQTTHVDWAVGDTYEDSVTGIKVTIDAQTETGYQLTIVFDESSSDDINIPNPDFKSYLTEIYDCDGDGEINKVEARSVFSLDMPSNVTDLTGLEEFVNLQNLVCAYMGLAELPDLSNLVNLENLNCAGNQLTELAGVEKMTYLKILIADGNQLTHGNFLQDLRQLRYVELSRNPIAEMPDLRDRPDLYGFQANETLLTKAPDFAGNWQLSFVSLGRGQLKDISGIANAPNLSFLQLHLNQISNIDALANLERMTDLALNGNQITHLPDLNGMPNLRTLYLTDNHLSQVPDVSGLADLREFYIDYNDLDLGDCAALSQLKLLVNVIEFKQQNNDVYIDCYPTGVHLTDLDGGFSTEIIVRNHRQAEAEFSLQGINNLNEIFQSNPATIEQDITYRIPQEDIFEENVSNLQLQGCETCSLSLSYRAKTEDSSSAEILQKNEFKKRFIVYPGDWDKLTDGAAFLNVSEEPTTIEAELFRDYGNPVGKVVLHEALAPGQKGLSLFQDYFPNLEGSPFIVITADQYIATTFLRFSKDSRYIYTNQSLPDTPVEGERWLAHITSQDGGFDSEIYVHNLTATEQTIHLKSFDPEGLYLGTTNLGVSPGQVVSVPKDHYFHPATSHSSITGDPGVVVSVGYRAQLPVASEAIVHQTTPVQTSFQLFPGDWDLLFDGVALVNASLNTTDITLKQVSYDGEILDEVILAEELAPNQKFLGLLENYLTPREDSIIHIESTQPLAVMALRLSKDLKYLYGNDIVK